MNPQIDSPAGSELRLLIAGVCVVVLGAALRLASPLLVPLAIALFIVFASLPLLGWLRRRGLPRPLAIAGIVSLATALLAAVGWILIRSANQVRDALPAYAGRLRLLEASLADALHRWGIEVAPLSSAETLQPERLLDLAARMAASLTGLLTSALIVLFFVVFMLTEADALPGKLQRALGKRMIELRNAAPIVEEVQQYLALKTMISLATGALVAMAAVAIGVDFALFWGLLAFLLNYIPNIGSVVAAVPAVLLALVQLGPGQALLLGGAYLGINIMLGNFLDPLIMGRRMGLSTVVVLLSLLFWGWAWGPVGMVLSLPLTMAVKIALEGSADYRWIAVLLGPASPGDVVGGRGIMPPTRSDAPVPPQPPAGQAASTGARR
jgi:AI-2 transport protein TqsA